MKTLNSHQTVADLKHQINILFWLLFIVAGIGAMH